MSRQVGRAALKKCPTLTEDRTARSLENGMRNVRKEYDENESATQWRTMQRPAKLPAFFEAPRPRGNANLLRMLAVGQLRSDRRKYFPTLPPIVYHLDSL